MAEEATIEFWGLCLFAKSKDGQAIHVMLARPDHVASSEGHAHDMKHQSTLRTRMNGKWKAVKMQPDDQTIPYGIKGTGAVGMPGELQMANVSNMPNGKVLAESSIRAGNGACGIHIILHGGSLTADPCVGVWKVEGASGEFRLPHRVTWRGAVEANGAGGLHNGEKIQIWHATTEESPTIGDDSQDPKSTMSSEAAAMAAARHFRAYYQIVAGTDGPTLKCVKSEGCPETPDQKGIIITSCPIAQATLV